MAAAVTSKGARDIDRELGITDKANAADQKYQISQRATQAKARKLCFIKILKLIIQLVFVSFVVVPC